MTTLLPPADLQRGPADDLVDVEIWHASTPKRIARNCIPGEPGRGWDAWSAHLKKRGPSRFLVSRDKNEPAPLAWALPAAHARSPVDFIRELGVESRKPKGARKKVELIESWFALAQDAAGIAELGCQALAVAHVWPSLAPHAPVELWWEVYDFLLDTARDSAGIDRRQHPLAAQLLAGELPLTLAWLFPELQACRELAPAGRSALAATFAVVASPGGVPLPGHLDVAGAILASWTRCRLMDPELARAEESADRADSAADKHRHAMGAEAGPAVAPSPVPENGHAEPHAHRHALGAEGGGHVVGRLQTPHVPSGLESGYRAYLTNVLRLVGPGRKLHLASERSAPLAAGLLEAAVRASDDKGLRAAARSTGLVAVNGSHKKRPRPSAHADVSRLAILRDRWDASGIALAVDYSGSQVRIELSAGRGPILVGNWELDVRQNGERVSPAGDWEATCWESDDRVDFLELERRFAGGMRVQRQFLLPREDRFLYVADVLFGAGSRLAYRGSLPLAPRVLFRPAESTREGLLVGAKRLALAMPIGLPEWRSDSHDGELAAIDQELILSQELAGRNLCCPMFFDLDPARSKKPFTWRQLTVAEQRRNLPRDAAAGYRVQCGREQWLFYCTLDRKANRTVLGQNLYADFFAGRFSRKGVAEELVRLE